MQFEILNQNEITKSKITEEIEKTVGLVRTGFADPLEAITRAKVLEEMAKELKKAVQDMAEIEFDKYGKNEKVTSHGITISMKSRAGSLDYEKDEQYSLLKQQLADRKALLDNAFDLHQKHNDELVVSGEVVPVVPMKTGGSTYFNFSIKK